MSAKDMALKAAQALLKKIDTPEKAVALIGKERENYLKALDVAYGSQAKRATEMGFDFNATQFHGTGSTFPQFKPSSYGTYGPGIYSTPSSKEASKYAIKADEAQQVLPIVTKQSKLYFDANKGNIKEIPGFETLSKEKQLDVLYSHDERAKWLKEKGFAGITETKGKEKYRSTFDPKNIRSKFAAFDPRFKNSPYLMAGFAPSVYPSQESMSPLQYLKKGFQAYEKGKEKIAGALAERMVPTNPFSSREQISKEREQLTNLGSMLIDPLNAIPGVAGAAIGALQIGSQVVPEQKAYGGRIKDKESKMDYELLNEDDNTFRLKDKKGKEFSIAKKAISDAMMQKIRGYAKGGMVTSETPESMFSSPTMQFGAQPTVADVALQSLKQPIAVFDDVQKQEALERQLNERAELEKAAQIRSTRLPMAASLFRDELAFEPMSPFEESQIRQRAQTKMIEEREKKESIAAQQASLAYKQAMAENAGRAELGLPPKQLPTQIMPGLVAGQMTGDAMPRTQITQESLDRYQGQVPAPDMMADMFMRQQQAGAGGASDLQRAAKLQEQAGIRLAEEQERIRREQDEAARVALDVYNQNMEKVRQENEQLSKMINDNQINPNRLFAEASVPAKLSAGLGLILGGIGQGLAGGSNQAMDTLNRMIDRDIDAQKSNLGKVQSLYAMNLQKLGDERAAYAATKAQQIEYVNNQLAQAAARAQVPQVQAAALQAQAQIKGYQQQLNAQVANRQVGRQMTEYVRKTGDPRFVEYIPDEKERQSIRERLVPGYGVATTADRAKKLMETASTNEATNRMINDLMAIDKRRFESFSPEQRAQAQTIQNALIGQLRVAIVGPGAMSESEREILQNLIANPTELFSVTSKVRLQKLQQIVNRAFDSELKMSGIQPKPRLQLSTPVK